MLYLVSTYSSLSITALTECFIQSPKLPSVVSVIMTAPCIESLAVGLR